MYPNAKDPVAGIFVYEQVESIKLLRPDISIEVFVIRGKSVVKYLVAVLKILKLNFQGKFNIIHAHYGLSGIVARFQIKTPVVVSYTGSDLLGIIGKSLRRTMLSKLIALANMQLSRIIQASIVKSDEMNALLKKKGSVIPNGVDLNIFKPMRKEYCRKLLHLDEGKHYILTLASPNKYNKRLDLIKETVNLLNKKHGNVELINPQKIPHSEVALYMNAADVYILLSHTEGSPNVIKEALACNCPIVATKVGDVESLIHGVENCYICSRNISDAMNKIERVFGAKSRNNGANRIKELNLDMESVALKVIKVYENILNKP